MSSYDSSDYLTESSSDESDVEEFARDNMLPMSPTLKRVVKNGKYEMTEDGLVILESEDESEYSSSDSESGEYSESVVTTSDSEFSSDCGGESECETECKTVCEPEPESESEEEIFFRVSSDEDEDVVCRPYSFH